MKVVKVKHREEVSQVSYLETKVKHLTNDLRLTKKENESSTRKYFELYSHLERAIERCTAELERANEKLRNEIADRKQVERALRESESLYRMLAENVSDVIWTTDMNLRFTYMSPSTVKLRGYSTEEVMAQSLEEILTPASYRLATEVFKEELAIEAREQKILFRPRTIELEQRCKDGSTVWTEVNVSFLRDNKGEPTGILGVTRDISERIQAEEEKGKLEAQLQKAQKMEAIGTLAGGVAHDFNNLLMGIQGRTSLMSFDIDSEHPHWKHLKGIEEMVKSASGLTRQLLGFARGGKYEVNTIDLNELIEKSLELFGRTKKEITIHKEYQEGVWNVEVDGGQIEQVLLNLYVNASQAMPGGGELSLRTENATLHEDCVKIFTIKPGNYVKISVADTGGGMDEETQRRIFEPFFTTKEMGRGTGLGLASAYGIIKSHGGYITVHSEKGEGTTFTIYLPASGKEIPKERKSQKEVLKGKETVLLIDDERMILETGEKILEYLGYKTMVAPGGQEAIDIYKENKDEIDLVILDMIMPEMSGENTYDLLKKVNPAIKVLLSSGYSSNGLAEKILDRGCNGFIQKPFNIKELSESLRNIIDGSSSQSRSSERMTDQVRSAAL